MLKTFFILALALAVASSQMLNFLTDSAMNQIRGTFNNAIRDFVPQVETFSTGVENFEHFIESFDRAAEYDEEEEQKPTVECPSSLLLSCNPPHRYVPALAYDNYDGTWTYCVKYENYCEKCFRF